MSDFEEKFIGDKVNRKLLYLEYKELKVIVYVHWLETWFDIYISTKDFEEYISVNNEEVAINKARRKFNYFLKLYYKI